MKENIIIRELENSTFTVSYGDKYADEVSFDEMLEIVTQLTMPEKKRCISWLKTEKEHDWFKRFLNENKNADSEDRE